MCPRHTAIARERMAIVGTHVSTKRDGRDELRDTQFGRWIIDVLRHLHDPVFLQSHPLSRYVAGEEGHPPGNPLRRDVMSAMDELCRAPVANRTTTRGHDVLRLYYVQCLSRADIQNRLQISRTEFHRALAKGQERLIQSLARRWGAPVTTT